MTNFEKYKNEILRIIEVSDHGNASVKNGIPISCEDVGCVDCVFSKNTNCVRSFYDWLYEDDGEEHGGCNGCKYEYKEEYESPCTECCNNYKSKWKRKPKKTRQDEFLELFPNAELAGSVIKICPKRLDGNYDRCGISCIECHKDYWLQEVEE